MHPKVDPGSWNRTNDLPPVGRMLHLWATVETVLGRKSEYPVLRAPTFQWRAATNRVLVTELAWSVTSQGKRTAWLNGIQRTRRLIRIYFGVARGARSCIVRYAFTHCTSTPRAMSLEQWFLQRWIFTCVICVRGPWAQWLRSGKYARQAEGHRSNSGSRDRLLDM